MFTVDTFTLLSRLMRSRWSRRYEEQQTAWEETVSAQLGPFYLESNDSFVLDHSDVYLAIALPLPRWQSGHFGKFRAGRWQRHILELGYRACRGEEQVRPTGFEIVCWQPFFKSTTMRNK